MKQILAALLAMLLLAGCTPTQEPSSPASEPESQSSSSAPDSGEPASESVPEEPAGPVIDPAGQPNLPTEEPSSDQTTASWWETDLSPESLVAEIDPNLGFVTCGTPEGQYYIYDDAAKLSWSGSGVFAVSEKAAATDPAGLFNGAAEIQDLGARILPDTFFEIVTKDDTKVTGRLYENGVELIESLPGSGYGNTVKLALTPENYQTLQQNLAASRTAADERGWYYPSWLTMMKESRVTELVFSTDLEVGEGREPSTGVETRFNSSNPWPYYVFDDLMVEVTGPAQSTDATSLPGASHASVTFNNGLVYSIDLTDSQLLVRTNGTEGGLLYSTRFDTNVFEKTAQGHLNPPTGKPVIYLYPTEPTDCTVTVDYEPFTYTYPAYDDGWQVTAYPDGRLVNKADGTEHYYLFWEGGARPDWSFDSGFVVAGADTEAFLREKLAYLGLTPREYNDFITYWVPRMQQNRYNLITFAADEYEALAPLTVTPAPDTVLRVHMVFLPLEQPVEIPEQQLTPTERKGFTVVEWGGTDASYLLPDSDR